MNLLLLEAGELRPDGRARLGGRRARHLLEVLRVAPGRVLRAGLVGGGVGTARVLAAGDGAVEVRLETLAPAPAPPAEIDLVLALPRPKVLARVLRITAAFGVRSLALVNAWRVEKSYFGSPALAPDAVRRQLLLGAEQGGTTRLPEVALHRLFVPFVRELGRAPEAGAAGRAEIRLLAHPGERPVERVLAPDAAAPGGRPPSVRLALGPEGGWIDRELASWRDAGFLPAALGPWVLPVEAAVAAALAQVHLLLRRS